MPWLQLKLDAQPESAEHLSELLSQAGAGAVTLQDAADQPILEPAPGSTPLWQSMYVIGLFEADTNIEAVLAFVQAKLGDKPLPSWHLNPLEDKDWVRAWMEHFKPMQFGEQLWICPSESSPPAPEACNIMLDPGLAFGTGTHPTTAMCLTWLDAHPPQGLEVIDYGCGSGILAIAARKLGASKVWAVDNDPQALIATQDNAAKNQVSAEIEALLPDALPQLTVPLLLANILAGPLVSLAPLFAKHVAPGGQLVLSGILASQMDEIMQAYQPWFTVTLFRQQEEWICLEGRKTTE